jgi:hypothetical protein
MDPMIRLCSGLYESSNGHLKWRYVFELPPGVNQSSYCSLSLPLLASTRSVSTFWSLSILVGGNMANYVKDFFISLIAMCTMAFVSCLLASDFFTGFLDCFYFWEFSVLVLFG